MRHAAVAAVLLCVLGSSIVAAQDCLGLAPFQSRPVHLFLRGSFSEPTNLYGGGVQVGGSAAFAELDVEGVSVSDLGAAAFTIGSGGGLQLPLGKNGSAQLCPIAAVSFALGPNNVDDAGIHYRETDYTFGAALGVQANRSNHQVTIVPTASVVWTHAHNRFTDFNGVLLASHSRSLGIVDLGVGILIGRDVSVTPAISHISGGSASTVFGVRFTIALGGTRTAIVNTHPTSCAGLASTDSTVYDTTQVSERPRIRTAPEVRYPQLQRDLHIGGRVRLGVIVGTDGTPEDSSVQVVDRVDPALDREAVSWLAGVTYWPACRDGRPVRARIAQPLDFCVAGCRQGKS